MHFYDCDKWKKGCKNCPNLNTHFNFKHDNCSLHWNLKRNILKEIKSYSDIEKEYKDKQEILQKDFEDKKNDLYKSLKEGPINRLSYILHMMEMINTFIDNDPVRAKLELTNIKNDLQLISKEIEKTAAVPEGDNL